MAMTKIAILYTVLISGGAVAVAEAVTMLYRDGSQAVPLWQQAFAPGPLSTKHGFLAEKCESCHTPVRGVEAQACIACHATAAADLAKQSTAFHGTLQECRGCHDEHEGRRRPTRMDHGALVRIGSRLKGDGAASISRQIGDDLAAYIGIQSTADMEQGPLACASCHGYQDPHRDLFGRNCADCHVTRTWRIASFLHPSAASRDCAQCHQAPPSHYMGHFMMVSMMVAGQRHAQVNQCYLCHLTNSFNEIRGAGWYKHH